MSIKFCKKLICLFVLPALLFAGENEKKDRPPFKKFAVARAEKDRLLPLRGIRSSPQTIALSPSAFSLSDGGIFLPSFSEDLNIQVLKFPMLNSQPKADIAVTIPANFDRRKKTSMHFNMLIPESIHPQKGKVSFAVYAQIIRDKPSDKKFFFIEKFTKKVSALPFGKGPKAFKAKIDINSTLFKPNQLVVFRIERRVKSIPETMLLRSKTAEMDGETSMSAVSINYNESSCTGPVFPFGNPSCPIVFSYSVSFTVPYFPSAGVQCYKVIYYEPTCTPQ